jgi:ectoine hydroxylase-related dioxygenase (phytanoyl-CoA dioxygenase family)
MYAALDEAGCLVVHGMAGADATAAVRAELADHMTAARVADDKPGDFYPGNTRRVVALMHRSPTVRELMMHPTVEQLSDRHLLANCNKWQLNVTAALEVGPGARDQILHREEDLFPYFALPRPNLILATMWAIADFTVENGGTQLVPGSHRWDADRIAEPDEVVRAEMPAGSVLFWLGGTLHGAGANSTDDDWRYGIVLTYTLGWLRQEENQHVSMPLADALALPDAMRSRLGFDTDYEGSLGFYDRSVLLAPTRGAPS